MYRISFSIPTVIIDKLISDLILSKIKKEYPILKLVIQITNYIKSKPNVVIKKCKGDLGANTLTDRDLKDQIEIDSRLQLNEIPSLIIHECIHGLFTQLIESDVEKLEIYLMRKLKFSHIDNIIYNFWKYCKPKYKIVKRRLELKTKKFMRRM